MEEVNPLLAVANQRAARWKELCRNLLNGMQSVFASYELDIDGKATPTVETAGLYKCCVEHVKAIDEPESGETVCPQCLAVVKLNNNTWSAANC